MAIFKYTELIPTEKELEYAPCIACGSEDVSFSIYPDGENDHILEASAHCHNCSAFIGERYLSMKGNLDTHYPRLISSWNRNNLPDLLRKQYEQQIDELQQKLAKLKP